VYGTRDEHERVHRFPLKQSLKQPILHSGVTRLTRMYVRAYGSIAVKLTRKVEL